MLSSIGTVTRTVRERIPFPTFGLDKDTAFAYKLLIPALAMMCVIHFVPIVWGTVISFLQVDPSTLTHWTESQFVGLDHYLEILQPSTSTGSEFWFALRQTILFGLGSTIGVYVLGLGTALLLNMDFRGKLIARTVVLIPYLAPVIATVFIWRMMFAKNTGIFYDLVMMTGLFGDSFFWLIGSNALYSILIVNIWRNFPFAAIMLYAGLQSIPNQLYEAADIDGAGRWEKFRYITFPQLRPVSAVIILLMIVWSFINFVIPYLLLGQQAGGGETLMLYIYKIAFDNFSYGLGAAMSVILFLIAMVISYAYYRATLSADTQGGAI